MIDIIEKLFPNSQYKEVFLKDDPRALKAGISHKAVSYTHLTLPTNREV